MSGSGSAVATRNGHAPAQQSAALAIRGNQSMWDDKQRAALVAMGVSEKATNAELAVFFHQCQRTQLDPFSKQIYLIHRKAKDGDRWVEKPTTQIGIDGFRVIRDRIADKKGLRVEYEDTIWYDGDRNAYDVWVDDEEPAACKVVILVDGRRFPSVLRFNEYCQRSTKDGSRTGRWRDAFAHQVEKCAEADALRKAFPNDMAGLVLEDAAPLDDPDAPAVLPQDRPRVTAEQARARNPQAVTAVATVVTPNVPPADEQDPSPASSEPPAEPAGGTASPGLVGVIQGHLERLGVKERAAKLRVVGLLAGRAVGSSKDLTPAEGKKVADTLEQLADGAALDLKRAELEMAADPRDEDGTAAGE